MIGIMFDMREACEKVLEHLAERDPTFKYSIYNSRFPQYDQIIIVSSGSRDQAHKRGLLLTKRYFPQEYGLIYWVKEVSMANTQVESGELETGNSWKITRGKK